MDHRETIERYYRCFRERDLEGLRALLTPDFHHVSPFGEHSDRDEMLRVIWPSVGRTHARELRIYGETPEFMVRYVVDSPDGPSRTMAEHIRFEGEAIAEIEVFPGRELSG